jgi:hypothetical protein
MLRSASSLVHTYTSPSNEAMACAPVAYPGAWPANENGTLSPTCLPGTEAG